MTVDETPAALPHRILAIDAAQGRAAVWLVVGDQLMAYRIAPQAIGLADGLAASVAACLGEAAMAATALDAVAVTIGPGSFTGLRAATALAQGIGDAAGVPVHGITMGEPFRAMFPALHRPLWVALAARRGRVFLDIDGIARGFDDEAIPMPDRPVALAGDQAGPVAATLAARGCDVMLTDARHCSGLAIASALGQRIACGQPRRPALPLYIDPPQAKLPAAGLRPAPR